MSSSQFDFPSIVASNLPFPAPDGWDGSYPPFNFTGGHNAPEEVPVGDLIKAATTALEKHGDKLATYMLDSGWLGHQPLRDFLVGKLNSFSGIDCTANQILLTSGSLQAIDLVNEALLEPGDTVIMEEATYEGCLSRYQRAGVTPIGIPLDEGGMRMDKLKEALEECKARRVTPKYIYVIPTVQNPTSSIMSLDRRMELLALAEEYGAPIFEDECYADLIWPDASGKTQRPPSLYALDKRKGTIFIGSFSKSLAPALRVGYIVADWSVLGQMVSCKHDAGSGALEQIVLAEYCTEHFDAHVARLNGALEKRLDALTSAVEQYFGTAAEFDRPPGGIFLWIKLPAEVDTTKLALIAAGQGISINPGAAWSYKMESATQYIRICFASPGAEVINEGVKKLAEICHAEFGVPTRIANEQQ